MTEVLWSASIADSSQGQKSIAAFKTLQTVVYIRNDAETKHLEAFDRLQTEQEHFKQVM